MLCVRDRCGGEAVSEVELWDREVRRERSKRVIEVQVQITRQVWVARVVG